MDKERKSCVTTIKQIHLKARSVKMVAKMVARLVKRSLIVKYAEITQRKSLSAKRRHTQRTKVKWMKTRQPQYDLTFTTTGTHQLNIFYKLMSVHISQKNEDTSERESLGTRYDVGWIETITNHQRNVVYSVPKKLCSLRCNILANIL